MKTTLVELALKRWPYGLEVRPLANGLLLRPRRKARANWRKTFRRSRLTSDNLAGTRSIRNEFDVKEWKW